MNPKHNRSLWLVLIFTTALAGACGDDDDGGDNNDDGDGAAVCGDGVINGTEECDGTALGASTCSTVGEFNGGELACSTECTFDTSACTNDIPETCGNGVIDADEGEDCDGTELGSATCASRGFGDGELACAADCSFDESACEASPSQQIADVRAAADGGGLSLPIAGAIVTYVKPALGQDPAGFFIQAEQAGPALFVAPEEVPEVAVGDVVSLTVTEKVTSAGQPRAIAIEGLTVDSNGANVEDLVQDVTGAMDLVSALGAYDSELVELDATITSAFTGAGNPAVASTIATTGLPADPGLRFRLDGELREEIGLDEGCVVHIGPTPLWRFNDTAQASAWTADDVTVVSCPAPTVVSAIAPSATAVVITFSRAILASSAQIADFDFDNGLNATAVAVDGATVTVTTETQTAQQEYTVTVTGVTDILGTAIDEEADTATFTGFGDVEIVCDDNLDNDADGDVDCFDPDCSGNAACDFGDGLVLWELDADQAVNPDSVEFVEVRNVSGATVNLAEQGWYLFLVNGGNLLTYTVVRLGPGNLANGDVRVVGSGNVPNVDQDVFETDSLQNGADGVLLVRCDACTGEADFGDDFDTGTGETFTSLSGATATKIDAVAYDTDDNDIPALWEKLINVTTQFNENGAGTGGTAGLQRTSARNWLPLAPTAGNP